MNELVSAKCGRRPEQNVAQLPLTVIGVAVAPAFGVNGAIEGGRVGLLFFSSCANPLLVDLRGTKEREGKPLTATVLAVADELAAAAGLLRNAAWENRAHGSQIVPLFATFGERRFSRGR